ncbi:MAG: UvrD-helicase domain-containing protein [Ruminococcus sp.]|nr:UvrD-helicase domain-containing protein [Ruminococcus sp.]
MADKAVKWTQDQINAIRSDGTVLVSAAAGSGKTAVLAQYVLRQITGENSVDVDRLLVLTFTRDAASEMKQRIQKELDKRIASEGAVPQLLRQKQKLYTAHISTTDSFCSSLVRERFSALGIAPDFRIAGDEEIATVSSKALDMALEAFYASNSPDFRALLRAFASNGTDFGLRDVVVKIHRFLQNQPFRPQWLDEWVKRYTRMDFTSTEWAQELLRAMPSLLEDMRSELSAAIATNELTPPLQALLIPLLESDLVSLSEAGGALTQKGYSGFCQKLTELFVASYPETPKIEEKLLKGKKTAVKNLLSLRASVREKLLSFLGAEDEISRFSGMMVTLSEIVSAYDREVGKLKERRNIRTFSDVSLLTVQLLAECCVKEEAEFCTGGFY